MKDEFSITGDALPALIFGVLAFVGLWLLFDIQTWGVPEYVFTR